MPQIDTVILRSLDPVSQRQFYCEIMGMKVLADDTVGYSEREARLSFVPASKPYNPTPADVYWKIAVAVPNIELAYRQLTERGVSVSVPRQFQNIGYLAHFTDPEGFTVELIEHWFEGQRPAKAADPSFLGGGAHLNLLTLRCDNIENVIDTCERWNMTPLSIQPVEEHGFTLYFYAFTRDDPPSSDLYAIENRTWVYQRPYTVLEIQHVHATASIIKTKDGTAGYTGTVVSGLPVNARCNDLEITPSTSTALE